MQFEPAPPIGTRVLAYLAQAALAPGDQLPSEAELSRALGISRGTLREAYAKLATEGVIERRHGVGTFLRKPLIDINPNAQQGFWATIAAAGYAPSLTVLDSGEVRADAEIAHRLNLEPETAVLRLRWLFSADAAPVVYVEHFVTPGIAIDPDEAAEARNLVDLLARRRSLTGGRLETWKTAVNAPKAVAEILTLPVGAALLFGHAVVLTRDDVPIAASRIWMEPSQMGERLVTPLAPLPNA